MLNLKLNFILVKMYNMSQAIINAIKIKFDLGTLKIIYYIIKHTTYKKRKFVQLS